MELTSPEMQFDHPAFRERRARIVERMKAGGYWKNVMDAGSDLDRVKEFLLAFAELRPPVPIDPVQRPRFLPPFPGLPHAAFHDSSGLDWVERLESSFAGIREEAASLEKAPSYVDFAPGIVKGGEWSAFPFYYMGLRVRHCVAACPKTMSVLDALPNICPLYPWGDMLFSKHSPGTHLIPHCSVDNLRLRCHFGVVVPQGSRIRVGAETRAWEEGKALLFEDSFEHEVWNDGGTNRVILIVDFWHPGLTSSEKDALLAGFRKSEIRALLCDFRLKTDKATYDRLVKDFESQDGEETVRRFWH